MEEEKEDDVYATQMIYFDFETKDWQGPLSSVASLRLDRDRAGGGARGLQPPPPLLSGKK